MKQVIFYRTELGKCLFTDWFKSLDNSIKPRVVKRINQLESGNLGDCKKISTDLSELRLKFGSGYRIYYTESEDIIILILCAGDKSTQNRDIKKAQEIIKEIKE